MVAFRALLLTVLTVSVTGDYASVNLDSNGYDGITIAINPAVPENDILITNLRNAFTSASATLYTATRKRAFFRNINILVPKTWTSRRYPRGVGLAYRKADVIIAPANPTKGNNPYTRQTGGCGEPGTYIHFTPEYMFDPQENIYGPIAKAIVHEWAHLRWGVFDEYPTGNHSRHYLDSNSVLQATRCPLSMRGLNIEYVEPYNESCAINPQTLLPSSDHCHFFAEQEQSRQLKTSMMGLSYLQTVIEFCHSNASDPINQHNSEADNAQNRRCNLRSTWDVITSTSDFANGANPPNPGLLNLAPIFRVVGVAPSRRFILVLDVSGSMHGNRLTMMQQSAGTFVSTSVSTGDYVGIVEFERTARNLQSLTQITSQAVRDQIQQNIPNVAGGSTCIGCGIQEAVQEMENHNAIETCGHIIVLTDGGENTPPYIRDVAQNAKSKNCTIDAIFFTTTQNRALTDLVEETGGKWFFAQDQDLRRLMGAFAAIAVEDDGDITNLVSTIAYKQHVLAAGENANGVVTIDNTVGLNTTFKFAFQTGAPVVQLTAPSGCIYTTIPFSMPSACAGHPLARIDTTLKLIDFVIPGRAEVGTWIYDISTSLRETISVSVTSKAEANVLPIVVITRTRSATSSVNAPVVIEATVTRGDPGQPMLNLDVVAVIEKPDSTTERLVLLDNGAGADTIENDGVYSRTFSGFSSRGRYSIQVEVNGTLESTGAASFASGSPAPLIFGTILRNGTISGNPAAGRSIPIRSTDNDRGNFTRVKTSNGLEFVGEVISPQNDNLAPNQINDFSAAQIDPNNVTSGIRLHFTAPGDDADAGTATSYQVCYTFGTPRNLSTNFGGNICPFVSKLPSAATVRESFVLPSPNTSGMSGSVRMAIAITATDEAGNVSPVSNIVLLRFFIEPPVPKCPEAPSASSNGNEPIYSTSPTVVATSNYYNNGTTASYTCQQGFTIANGNSDTFTCNFGRWDQTSAPFCEPDTYSCNMTLSGSVGYSSPYLNSPNNNTATTVHNLDCYYSINAQSSTNVIKVNFRSFDLEKHPTCNHDYVAVYEGSTTSSRLIGKYCGTNSSFTVTGRGQYMYMHYHTDSSVPSAGFRFRYYIIPPRTVSCDQLSYGGGPGSGFITSPNHPRNYPHNADCRYRINAGSTSRTITLSFTSFNLERHAYCKFDYVDIRVGFKGDFAIPVRTYCGSSTPAPITITGQQYVYIQFFTDGSVPRSGFRLQYTISGVQSNDSCNMLLTGPSGYSSPYFSSPSGNTTTTVHNLDCYYRINAQSKANIIKVTFRPFELEKHPRCNFDYVAVYEGSTTRSRLIGKYCGTNSSFTVTGRGQYMYMHYHTDSSVPSAGFRFRYYIRPSRTVSCDQLSIGGGPGSGFITSPNHPSNYPHNSDCRYRINAGSTSRTITLSFTSFNLERHSYCKFDYVDIRVGFKGDFAIPVRRYCGPSTPAPITIIGQQYVYIQFFTDGSVSRSGFRLQYTISGSSECDQLNLGGEPGSTGLIKSPNYPNEYPKNIECKYRISSSSSSNMISLSFLAFNLEPNNQCRFDYLQVFVGRNTTSGSVGKYCGTITPSSITRRTHYISMKFKTDGSVTRSGFNVRYSISGSRYSMAGTITSPSYPANYHNNAENNYVIKPPGSHRIRLTFTNFNLEGSEPSCRFDSVVIKRGTKFGAQLDKFCGSKSRFTRIYAAKQLTLMFKTDQSVVRSGFRCVYSRHS